MCEDVTYDLLVFNKADDLHGTLTFRTNQRVHQCLEKDRNALLTFYDFHAEHWRHIRTTNPIESTFATVRLRMNKVRGCFSANTVLSMAFKLC